MIEFIAQNMAPIMFFSLIVFMLLGYPVAFSLAANGLLFFVIAVELAPLSNNTITLSWPLLYALPERFWGLHDGARFFPDARLNFAENLLRRKGATEDQRAQCH